MSALLHAISLSSLDESASSRNSPKIMCQMTIMQTLGRLETDDCLACWPQVMVACQARVPSSSGRQGEGVPFFSTPPDKPLHFTIGDNTAAPEGLQAAVCLMSKGDKAIVSCPASLLRSQPDCAVDLKAPSGVDRIELELHLRRLVEVSQQSPDRS